MRTFAVGTSYTVSDVNIGVLLAHTWRADLRMWLSSPAGTRIQIVNSNGGSADNFNVLLDSAIGTSVSTHSANDTATAGTVVPGYQRDFAPVSSLNAFNGESSTGAGQWTLEICDDAGGDSGTFYQADLFLSQVPTNYADLSVTKTVSNATPTSGAAIQYVVSLNNAASSPQTATGVVVSDLLPLGLTYTSHTVSAGGGTYTLGTGIWAVPSIAPNQTRTLTINATVSATAGATITNVAEVTASSHSDIDSTVNNGATGEDDYAARSLTVAGTRVAGVPPNLSVICGPNTPIVFDWDGKAWTAGTTNNNYTITGLGLINYALTTDVAFVTGSPAINATNTGGNGAGQQSLFLNMNNSSVFDVSTTVLTLPTAVPGMQFTMFDIDFGAGQWADKVTVTGSFNGATVIPTLTNNTANYVIGNTAIGDGSSSGD
ncbi:MAG: proprotein convertase P-domain-containing protein, partial [Parasphingorhabdus sp.]